MRCSTGIAIQLQHVVNEAVCFILFCRIIQTWLLRIYRAVEVFAKRNSLCGEMESGEQEHQTIFRGWRFVGAHSSGSVGWWAPIEYTSSSSS